jgi:hypothetical protein
MQAPSVRAAKAINLPMLALGLREVLRLLRAGSYAHVLQSRTRLEWVKQTGGIQNVYGALCGLFGTPGTAEVVFPDMTRAQDEVRRLTAERIDVFFDKCLLGPAAAGAYLQAMEELRIHSLRAIRETVADQMAINRDVARAWGVSIEYLADVHLISTVLVKIGGAVLPGPAGMIDFGYDIAVETLPDLLSSGRGTAVAFVTETAKETGEEGASWAGERIVDAINKRSTEADLEQAYRRLREAESKLNTTIDKIVERRQALASGATSHKIMQSLRQLEPRVERYAKHLDSAQKGLAKAGGVRAAAKAVSFVFLAMDVMQAFEKHTETVAAARQ